MPVSDGIEIFAPMAVLPTKIGDNISIYPIPTLRIGKIIVKSEHFIAYFSVQECAMSGKVVQFSALA